MIKNTVAIGIITTVMLIACTPLGGSPTSSSSSSSVQAQVTSSLSNEPRACTAEAKQCPDGSYVGRTGPNCEFTECPAASRPSSVPGRLEGRMTIGPICPVERPDHPCNPTPEMYASHTVFVYTWDRTKLISTLAPDAEGKFSVALPAGSYLVDVRHDAVGSANGVPATITINPEQTSMMVIAIDTGIR